MNKTFSKKPEAAYRAGEALALFVLALTLLLLVGEALRRYRPGPLGVAVTELVAILAPALLWSRARRSQVLTGLGLWPVDGRLLLGGLLVGAAWFYVMAALIEPQLERLVPLGEGERQKLLLLLRPPSGPRPLWQDLAAFAGAPALCEEVLFRGVLLPMLVLQLRGAAGAGPGGAGAGPARAGSREALLALGASSLLFGAFHLSPAKVLPTAVLGLGFGLAVLLTGSLWPGVAMHFANNALVILLVRGGHDEPPPLGPATLLAWAAAALLGALLLGRGARARPRTERNSDATPTPQKFES